MVMTHHRLPLLSRRHEISQGTEEPPPQQPLQSANPALPGNQPWRGRPRLPDDPAQPLRGRPPLPQGVINPDVPENQPRHGRPPLPQGVSNLALPENQPQNLDVLLYPMILPSLGLDVLVYLMHRHRIELPQVTLCPRHSGR